MAATVILESPSDIGYDVFLVSCERLEDILFSLYFSMLLSLLELVAR